jgi:hypothetical protein
MGGLLWFDTGYIAVGVGSRIKATGAVVNRRPVYTRRGPERLGVNRPEAPREQDALPITQLGRVKSFHLRNPVEAGVRGDNVTHA